MAAQPGAMASNPPASNVLPVLALTFNAVVWGTSWWAFRYLQSKGLHPLWATALSFAVAAATIAAWRPRAIGQVLRSPALWVLVVASGTTNAAFNWAVVIGDVVRVVLLFYLMPLWTIVLARLLLGEPFTARAALRVILGIAGAAAVLWPTDSADLAALPIPRSLPDWLGVLGGFSFALNNVMLRREAGRPEEGRAMAMFLGGAVVAGSLAVVLGPRYPGLHLPPFALAWFWPMLAVAAVFLAGNLALQFGAARLPANRTAVVMLTEVLFATASSVLLGGATLTRQALVGGALIVSAAVLAALDPPPAAPAVPADPVRPR
ncbi:MAG: DMT family transporter [Caldimonas sp.]